jgi:hypothetical protein
MSRVMPVLRCEPALPHLPLFERTKMRWTGRCDRVPSEGPTQLGLAALTAGGWYLVCRRRQTPRGSVQAGTEAVGPDVRSWSGRGGLGTALPKPTVRSG